MQIAAHAGPGVGHQGFDAVLLQHIKHPARHGQGRAQLAVQLRIAVAQAQRGAVGGAPAIGEGGVLGVCGRLQSRLRMQVRRKAG